MENRCNLRTDKPLSVHIYIPKNGLNAVFKPFLLGRGRRTRTLGTRFWSGSDRVLSENTPKFLLIFNINQYSEFVDNA